MASEIVQHQFGDLHVSAKSKGTRMWEGELARDGCGCPFHGLAALFISTVINQSTAARDKIKPISWDSHRHWSQLPLMYKYTPNHRRSIIIFVPALAHLPCVKTPRVLPRRCMSSRSALHQSKLFTPSSNGLKFVIFFAVQPFNSIYELYGNGIGLKYVFLTSSFLSICFWTNIFWKNTFADS